MNKIAIVFGNGTYEEKEYYLELIKKYPKALIVASDGGYNFLKKNNIKVDLIIGDLDSIKDNADSIKTLKYPVEKDETDTELVLKYLTNRNYKLIFLVGMISLDRIDHTLSNIFLLEKYSKEGTRVIIVNRNNELFCVKGPKEIKLSLKKGTTLSIIPLTNFVEDVTLKGFKYPLNKYMLSRESSGRSTSNIVVEKHQIIKLEEGIILIDILK